MILTNAREEKKLISHLKFIATDLISLPIFFPFLSQMCDNFATEKEHFKENARKDIQQEIDAMRKERADEIQQIHKRVQQAIEKKDASLDVLQKENAVLKERCMKLELVIRQQRKDYCTK